MDGSRDNRASSVQLGWNYTELGKNNSLTDSQLHFPLVKEIFYKKKYLLVIGNFVEENE